MSVKSDLKSRPEWKRLLAGGFAFMTAPFAVHKLDRDRAKDAVRLAKAEGISKNEFLEEARNYLKTAQGWPTDTSEQIKLVEKFVGNKLS